GSDSAISEFNAQKHLITKNTELTTSFNDLIYNINFTCLVFSGVGYYIVTYNQILDRYEQTDSVLYRKDVINCDRQDDEASYCLFCSSLLNQVINLDTSENIHYKLFIYLFVIGELIDAYQNRIILHLKRARMVIV
ncbi:13924_t:CDS:2, partial [Racocetra persica]